jgi:1-phosphofructokinase family hexose kinase
MILVVGHNSTWQKTCLLARLQRGEVNRVATVLFSAAGKGSNPPRVLKMLGLESLILGYAGGENGARFRRALEEEGLAHDLQAIRGETRLCTTLVEEDGTVTELIDPAPAVSSGEREGMRRRFERHLPRADLLLVGGTTVEGETDDCYRRYVEEAHRRGIPVLLDSFHRHGRLALEASPEILKINLRELEELCGRPLAEPAERRRAYLDLAERFGLRWIVITLGPAGVEGWDGRRLLRAVPPAVAVRNTIGSGDAVSAGVARGFLRGRGLAGTLRAAAALGTANCLTPIPGQVLRRDYLAVRRGVRIETEESPRS